MSTVIEFVPVQNQAATQKLLQKMSEQNQNDRQFKGRRNRGKERQNEQAVFTLDEWEERKAGAKTFKGDKIPDTSDEDLARQLQNQFNLEDSHVSILACLSNLTRLLIPSSSLLYLLIYPHHHFHY